MKLARARRSRTGGLPLARWAALAASVVITLSYPMASAAKLAADPAPQPLGNADPAQIGAFGLQLASDKAALDQAQSQVDAVGADLRQEAVNSYVDGGSPNALLQGGGGYETLLRKEYLATVAANEQAAVRRLERGRALLRAEQARFENDEQLAMGAEDQGGAQAASAVLSDQGTSATASLAINGPQDFAVVLLRALGDPVTPQNTQAIVAWCQREGGGWGNVARFNPLNTSMKMPGSHAINGDGVQSYTSWNEGLTATVATLHGGSYRGILAALRAGSSVGAVESAVAASPWGTHF